MVIFETIFDVLYLISVVCIGLVMIKRSKKFDQYRLFGMMAIVLGCGDAFHLVPRVYSMWTIGLENNAVALGFGQAVTSITMTLFYVMLYYIWEKRYEVKETKVLRFWVWALALLRVALCLFPQNDWLSSNAPLSWGIYRNIPFAIFGILMIVLFYQQARLHQDKAFKYMWLAIVLSFGFYAPVVLFSKTIPVIGALMMPKTCAYVWIVWMGYKAQKEAIK
ncbi:MAG: hypothetical protein RR585_03885 [Coprobacillus sp.]